MSAQNRIFKLIAFFVVIIIFFTEVHAAGLPESGLVMYGAARNTVAVTTSLTEISGQYSYMLSVPFESMVGSSTALNHVTQRSILFS